MWDLRKGEVIETPEWKASRAAGGGTRACGAAAGSTSGPCGSRDLELWQTLEAVERAAFAQNFDTGVVVREEVRVIYSRSL